MNARVLMLVAAVGVMAQEKTLPDTVAAYKEWFGTARKGLEREREEGVERAVKGYREMLLSLLTVAELKGDGECVRAVRGELIRLQTDPTPPKGPGDGSLPDLERGNLFCREQERTWTYVCRAKMGILAARYVRGLQGLIVRLEAGHDGPAVKEAVVAMEEAQALVVELGKPLPPVEKAVVLPAIVTVEVEAVIDGTVELLLGEKGIRWVCEGRARVGIGGTKGKRVEVPIKVDGKEWRPVFRRSKKGGRRSEWYPLEGLGGTNLVTVVGLREGVKPQTTSENRVVIRGDGEGPCVYLVTIRHGRVPRRGR